MGLNVGRDFQARWLLAPEAVRQQVFSELQSICQLLEIQTDYAQWQVADAQREQQHVQLVKVAYEEQQRVAELARQKAEQYAREQEQLAREQAEAQQRAAEFEAAEQLKKDELEQQRLEQQRLEAERLEIERLEVESQALETQRLAELEQQRVQAEQQRVAEQDRLKQEKEKQERQQKEQQAQQAELERLEQEQLQLEQQAAQAMATQVAKQLNDEQIAFQQKSVPADQRQLLTDALWLEAEIYIEETMQQLSARLKQQAKIEIEQIVSQADFEG